MLNPNADWLGVPRLHTLHTIGVCGIKTWRTFGAPSQFLFLLVLGKKQFFS